MSSHEVAGYLGRSSSWLSDRISELEQAGFPKPLPLVGGYDKAAVDRWLDKLGGKRETSSFHTAWMDAAND